MAYPPFPITLDRMGKNEFLTEVMANRCQLHQPGLDYKAQESDKHSSLVFNETLDARLQQLKFWSCRV